MNKRLNSLAWLMSVILLTLVAVASAQTGNQGAKASPIVPEQASPLPVQQSLPLSPSGATPSPTPTPVSVAENPEAAANSAAITAAESELQVQIQNAIGKDPILSGSSVSVAVSAEGIELSGSVTSGRARLAASRIAKSYAGSKKVVDKITVSLHSGDAPAEPTPDKINSAGARLRP
jgi:BON domain